MARFKILIEDAGDGGVRVDLEGQDSIDREEDPTPAEGLTALLLDVIDEVSDRIGKERLH